MEYVFVRHKLKITLTFLSFLKPSFTNQEKWTRAVIVANHIFVFRLFSLSDTVRIYTEKEATAYIK